MKAIDVFCAERVVAATDIDVLDHASNIAIVRWIQDVALAHAAAAGFDLAVFRRMGSVFVVARHEIDYLRPAVRGEHIEARTWISGLMAAKCLRSTEVRRRGDGEPIAKAVTAWGYVEIATGRPRRIPDEVRRAFPVVGRASIIDPGAAGGS